MAMLVQTKCTLGRGLLAPTKFRDFAGILLLSDDIIVIVLDHGSTSVLCNNDIILVTRYNVIVVTLACGHTE